MQTQKVKCPKCNRVVRSLGSYHYCEKIEIDALFLDKSDEILLIFLKLCEQLEKLEDIEISATKNCIVFLRNKTFVVAKPMRNFLQVKCYANELIEDEDIVKSQLWGNKYEHIFRYKERSDLKSNHFHYFFNSYQIS